MITEIELEKDLTQKNPNPYVPVQKELFKIPYPDRDDTSVANTQANIFQKLYLKIKSNRFVRLTFTWLSTIIKIGSLRREIFLRLDRADILNHQLEARLTDVLANLDGKVAELIKKHSTLEGSQVFINDTMNLDEYYYHFENRFRGPREQILSEMGTYIPLVKTLDIDFARHPILDVGCGRGEWLEVLKSAGISAKGIDINTKMIEVCKSMQLDAEVCDALVYLQRLPPKCIGGISAFQVVEHISFKELIEFLRECRRVLIPSGFVLFETPNPENFRVGSCDFYYDMSHVNPIPPETLGFLLGNSGFTQMETIRSQPVHENSESLVKIDNPAVNMVIERFFCPRNYAIFAKAHPS